MKTKLISSIFLITSLSFSNIKVGGYGDIQFQWSSATINGFSLNEAAAKLTYHKDKIYFHFDLPISSSFTLGGTKTQIFGRYSLDKDIFFQLGQFDRLFSQEDNDSNRYFFTSLNRVDSNLSPTTHLGMSFYWRLKEYLQITFLVANPRDTYSIGTGAYPDFGGKISATFSFFKPEIGFLYNYSTLVGWLLYAKTLFDLDRLNIQLGLELKGIQSNSLWGLYSSLIYNITQKWSMGLRGEFLSLTSSTNTIQITTGPRFNLLEELLLKLNYSLTNSNASTTHSVVASAVFDLD